MNYTHDELDKYEDYLLFVRRKMVDDLGLKVDNLMSIDIRDIRRDGDKWIYIFSLYPNYKNIPYESISFDQWMRLLLSIEREKKINKVLS